MATSRQETLTELVRMASKYINEQLIAMISRMVATTLDLSAPGIDPQSTYRRIQSGNLLKNNSYAFFHLVSNGLELALRKEIEQLAPSATVSAAQGTLSLVPLEEIDTRLAFAAISRPFDIAHSEQLASLSVRLGLLLGRDLPRASQNPFRPEVFLNAINEAWREFEPEPEAHGLILPLLRPDIVFDFAPMLEMLNDALKAAGGRAGRADRIRKTKDAAAQVTRASRDAALAQQLRRFFTGDPDLGIPLIPDLPSMPAGNGGWRPSGAIGFTSAQGGSATAGTAVVSGLAAGPAANQGAANGPSAATAPAPLLDLLSHLQPAQPSSQVAGTSGARPHQVFYLPRLKKSLPQGSLSRADEGTLDLLSRIFETILIDDSIPQETRELIDFLQVPVLKAALRDKSFFFEEAHPARRMIDLLSRMGWEQRKNSDDPMFQAMRRSVDKVAREQGQSGAFAEAVAELEASVAAEERAADAAIAAPIAQAARQEKQAAAARAAKDAVASRLGAEEVAAVVGAFLEQRWITVLMLAYSIEDDKPGAVGNATRAMDDLIWSVKPKATQEQRKALIGKLPGLITTLNKWLDAIKWQDAERLQFFAQLAECHAAIVRAPIELSPERQLELAVEAARQDALRRIAQEQAATEAETPCDEAAAALDSLERGMRLEFSQPGGGMRKVRLAWVSPLRTLFIFSGSGRQEAFSLSADKLAEAFRAGAVKVVALDGVVGRVLTAAFQQAAVNDPSVAGLAS